MEIKKVVVGMIETNCYIVTSGDEAILIDPGDESEKIIKELGDLKPKMIVLTHLHFDHITAVREIKEKTGAKVYCYKDDLEILDEDLLKQNEIDGFLKNEAQLTCLPAYKLVVLLTPGHTPGSICLYSEKDKVLFSGDTIFRGTIGATHFKGGDFNKIKDSVENRLLTLPDDITVYPGHGEIFRLGDEKENITDMMN